jgi:hypothetical protein
MFSNKLLNVEESLADFLKYVGVIGPSLAELIGIVPVAVHRVRIDAQRLLVTAQPLKHDAGIAQTLKNVNSFSQ